MNFISGYCQRINGLLTELNVAPETTTSILSKLQKEMIRYNYDMIIASMCFFLYFYTRY